MKNSQPMTNDILTNPVELFSKNYPQASHQQLSALTLLEEEFSVLKEQLKLAQSKSKKTSRKIGEAKRYKRPTEELMQTMRQQSSVTKNLNETLNLTSNKILSYFDKKEICQNNTTKPSLSSARLHIERADKNEQVSICQLTDEYDKWNQYVLSNPSTSLYHRAEWKKLIETTFGHECYFFFAAVKNEIVGVLPLVRLNSKLFGDFMVSMPYFNSGGAIANSALIESRLIDSANDFAKTIGVSHIEYRDDVPRDSLPARTEKVNMILSLSNIGSEDQLWNKFPSKLRSQIRRAQREKTQTCIGGKEYLKDFYTVFAQNMRDLGTPVYSKSFFENILLTFPECSKIIIIRLQNRPVAAAFLLGNNNILEIPWASTVKSVNHLSINMLLYWEVLKYAIKKQYHYFDFGRSSKNAGTYRFKQQWGAQPKQLYWHYWLSKNVEMPQLNPNNPKFSLIINIWKRTPVFLTKIIGPFIVKNLP